MIAVLAAICIGQSLDIEALNRTAIASLPQKRMFRASCLISDDIFVTFTYDQLWYTYAEDSELYPSKFIGNEYGYLDLWERKGTRLRHIAKMAIGNMIPGWDRFPASFAKPKARSGAVFISEPPSGSVPWVEFVGIYAKPPYFKPLYRGLGMPGTVKTTSDVVQVSYKGIKINLRDFVNLGKRYIVTPRTMTAHF